MNLKQQPRTGLKLRTKVLIITGAGVTAIGTILAIFLTTAGNLGTASEVFADPFVSSQQAEGPGGIGDNNSIIFWLRAGEGTSTTTDNSTLNHWHDQVNNHNAIGVGNAKPRYRDAVGVAMNDFPVVQFNGTSEYFKINNNSAINTSGQGYETRSIIIGFRTGSNVTNSQVIYEEGGQVNGFNFQIDQGQLFVGAWRQNHYVNHHSIPVVPNTSYIASLIFNAEDGVYKSYLNGTLIDSSNNVNTMPSHSGGIAIGRINGKTVFHDDVVGTGSSSSQDGAEFGGEISEIIMYDPALNDAQRTIVENYFAGKFGQQLNQTVDLYTQDDPANFNYDYEISGIGRENLIHMHSSAQNTSMLRIHSPSALDDGDYLIWGHDGHALSTGTLNIPWSGTPSQVTSALHRIWRVSETDGGSGDGVGTVSVTFELDNLNVGQPSQTVLLIDSDDGDFVNATVIAPTSSTGLSVTFDSVDLQDGNWFTLGGTSTTSVLPIELKSFFAKPLEAQVELQWITATELNNDYFTLERSADGINFEEIARVAGVGTSSSQTEYWYIDEEPLTGISYYRLKQTDFDGTSETFNVVTVELEVEILAMLEMNVYPTPLVRHNILNIDITADMSEEQPIQMVLTDLSGRSYFRQETQIHPGFNNLNIPGKAFQQQGTYLLTVLTPEKQYSKKVLVQ